VENLIGRGGFIVTARAKGSLAASVFVAVVFLVLVAGCSQDAGETAGAEQVEAAEDEGGAAPADEAKAVAPAAEAEEPARPLSDGLADSNNDPDIVELAKAALSCAWEEQAFTEGCKSIEDWRSSELLGKEESVDTLRNMLDDEDKKVRQLAFFALPSAITSRDELFPIYRTIARHDGWYSLRYQAQSAAWRLPRRFDEELREQACALLVDRLSDDDAYVASYAFQNVGASSCAQHWDAALDAMIQRAQGTFDSPSAARQFEALFPAGVRSLGTAEDASDEQKARAAEVAKALANNQALPGLYRGTAVDVLAALHPQPEPYLKELENDGEAHVRWAVERALAK
jgi:hypothetical protein